MLMIGRIWMPGLFNSNIKKLMPCWGLPLLSVRTKQNMWVARWAWVVQILEPLITHSLPSRRARHWSDAKSEPDPGSL